MILKILEKSVVSCDVHKYLKNEKIIVISNTKIRYLLLSVTSANGHPDKSNCPDRAVKYDG